MIIRSSKANMLILTCLALGLVVSMLIVGLGFYLILTDQKRGQAHCDEIALNFAKDLNGQDHFGQMNTIVEHSRELVYLARRTASAAYASGTPAYTILADKLVSAATEGAQLVEQERSNLIDVSVMNCRNNIISLSKPKTQSGSWVLNWFIEHGMKIEQVQFGSIGTLSSAGSPSLLDDLHQYDLVHHYVDKASNLYYGNINAKLPVPDDQLSFYFSPLPSRVENTDCPERLVNAETFIPAATIYDSRTPKFSKPKQLPEAILVTGSMRITTDSKNGKIALQATSAANLAGALNNP